MINSKNNIALRTEKLRKNFGGDDILKNIDFEVYHGEIISIIGRSGCGKTTLLRCLNFLNILNEGKITIAGMEIDGKDFNGYKIGDSNSAKYSKSDNYLKDSMQFVSNEDLQNKVHNIRQKVGFLFQSLNLFPHLTVAENIMLPLTKVLNYSKDEARTRAEELLTKVGMKKHADRNSSRISGGQAQRVAIARALSTNPEIMLYDEPTSALDPELVLEFIDIIKELHSDGMTQIIVTHSLGLARQISGRVAFMDLGEIVEIDVPEVIFNNPQNTKTKDYIGKLLLA
ncbi:amino acid ABC transporter ATP-binding protein [Candidatus Kapaibacterium sp.]